MTLAPANAPTGGNDHQIGNREEQDEVDVAGELPELLAQLESSDGKHEGILGLRRRDVTDDSDRTASIPKLGFDRRKAPNGCEVDVSEFGLDCLEGRIRLRIRENVHDGATSTQMSREQLAARLHLGQLLFGDSLPPHPALATRPPGDSDHPALRPRRGE